MQGDKKLAPTAQAASASRDERSPGPQHGVWTMDLQL